MINLTILSGSHRKTSESGKVAHYFENVIKSTSPFNSQFNSSLLDLAHSNLPFYDDVRAEDDEKNFKDLWTPIASKLENSDAFIIISPEWNGMAPAYLKNLFLLANREFYHKPALLVTVSAGLGGHYPIAELRMSSYKNSRLLYLPEHLIIRNVCDFNENPNDDKFTEVRERFINDLHMLYMYSRRLQGLGKEVLQLPYTETYPNGM